MQNEKLCWTRYKYAAQSGNTLIIGLIQLHYQPTRAQITQVTIDRAAREVLNLNEPWDPFNCSFVVTRDNSSSNGELTKEQFQQYMEDLFKGYE